MKKLVLFFVIGALGACGKLPDPAPAIPAAVTEDRNPFFTAPAQEPASAPVVQQAPAPQAAQTDSGPGWGSVVAAGAIGYLLGSSNKPAVAPAPAPRTVTVYRDVTRPAPVKPIVPVTPPKPNTIPVVQPPKPTVVAPSYVQRQNTPTTTSVPSTPRTTTTTPYRSSWTSSPIRSTPSFRR